MQPYLEPIKLAFISFPIISVLLTIPFAIYNYRKHGYVNRWRTFMMFTFLLFLISAYYLVIMPLPATRDIKSLQRPGTVHYNLKPFQFVRDILNESEVNFRDLKSYSLLLKERAFLQAGFNILLLLPMGIYLRYYFKRNLKETLIITFLSSLFFEITQLTGLYGIYNAPYRLFDIDDLFLNTMGGLIGYYITPLLLVFLPKTESLDENAGDKKYKVSIMRRLISLYIDLNIINLFSNILNGFIKNKIYSYSISYFIFMILITYITNGKSIGNYFTAIKIVGKSDKIKFKEVFIRWTSFLITTFGINKFSNYFIDINNSKYQYFMLMAFLSIVAWNIIIIFHFGYSYIKKRKFFYEVWSNTEFKVDSKKLNEE